MIKVIAFITMLLDHIGQVFFPQIYIIKILGRLALPLFAWGIARGYRRTTNFKRYVSRMFFLAIVSEIPHYLLFKSSYLNVCFTLLLGLLVLKSYEEVGVPIIKYSVIPVLLFLSEFSEYGMYGIATIIVFYAVERIDYVVILQSLITVLSIFMYRFEVVQVFSLLAPFIIRLLEKYDFRFNRALQYSFYPAHLTAILAYVSFFSYR